jgi:hypothetical protein
MKSTQKTLILTLKTLLIALTLIEPSRLHGQQLQQPQEYQWMQEYSDPTDLAKAFIEKTKIFWTPTGKTWVEQTYQPGYKSARYEEWYILLESPGLAAEMVKRGAYGTTCSMSYHVLENIIKTAIQSPDKFCKDLALSTIDEGLRDYKTAYNIAQNHIDNGIMTEDDAIAFLCNRWNFLKLGIASQLYIQSNTENDIPRQMSEISVKEILDQVESKIKLKPDVNKNLPLAQAVIFIKEVADILEIKSLGMMRYQPYLNYIKNTEVLNQIKLNELNRFGYTSCEGARVSFDDYTIVPGVRIGRINANTSMTDLIQVFGPQNVENKMVGHPGNMQPEYHTFINNNELEIVWKDNLEFLNPSMVIVPYYSKKYRTADDVKCGLSLENLRKINGRNLFLDYSQEILQWQISNYNTGALNTYQDKLVLYFCNTNLAPTRNFQSNEAWVKNAELKVCEMHVILDPEIVSK